MESKKLLHTTMENVSLYGKVGKIINEEELDYKEKVILTLVKKEWSRLPNNQNPLSREMIIDAIGFDEEVKNLFLNVQTQKYHENDLDYLIQKYKNEKRLEKITEINQNLEFALDTVETPEEKLEIYKNHAKDLEKLSLQETKKYAKSLEELAKKTFTEEPSVPIKTGYDFLDEKIGGGIYRKLISVIMGDSGHGKSLNSKMMALHMAKNGYKVLMLSVELTQEMLTEQMVSTLNKVPMKEWKAFRIKESDRSKRAAQAEELARVTNGNLFIDDGSEAPLTPERIVSTVENADKDGYDVIFLDYIQAVQLDKDDTFNDFSSRLTAAIKKTNAAMVALSQVTVAKGDKPQDALVKNGRQLWNDANLVMITYRDIEEEEFQEEDGEYINLYLKKNRQGEPDVLLRPPYFPSLGIIGDWEGVNVDHITGPEPDGIDIFEDLGIKIS